LQIYQGVLVNTFIFLKQDPDQATVFSIDLNRFGKKAAEYPRVTKQTLASIEIFVGAQEWIRVHSLGQHENENNPIESIEDLNPITKLVFPEGSIKLLRNISEFINQFDIAVPLDTTFSNEYDEAIKWLQHPKLQGQMPLFDGILQTLVQNDRLTDATMFMLQVVL
jgi:hypothetical protein